MTKNQFRRLALSGINQMLSLPDDLWEATHTMVTLSVGEESVVVGIRLRKEDEAEE